ncbi:hypothetical protein BCR33DRAFT_738095 [Rhizoclosmatium globosum]|uniref:Uncharacterized protein n=1 Tax=Rhizoclosmatium globosum TaxID=329046 RepID=A0A1Y2CBU7_9FUNG|nr:hypothetical protein BCR33DRAFT_738095 [Rhizoclosmatium globosum]|eukprot:ORY44512.1 hypothetical protein BCR33DRAFT_738095 [Rhizoclosmatium globosum]
MSIPTDLRLRWNSLSGSEQRRLRHAASNLSSLPQKPTPTPTPKAAVQVESRVPSSQPQPQSQSQSQSSQPLSQSRFQNSQNSQQKKSLVTPKVPSIDLLLKNGITRSLAQPALPLYSTTNTPAPVLTPTLPKMHSLMKSRQSRKPNHPNVSEPVKKSIPQPSSSSQGNSLSYLRSLANENERLYDDPSRVTSTIDYCQILTSDCDALDDVDSVVPTL